MVTPMGAPAGVHGYVNRCRDHERHNMPTALRRGPLIPFLAARDCFLEDVTFLKLETRG